MATALLDSTAERPVTEKTGTTGDDAAYGHPGVGMRGKCGCAHALFDFKLDRLFSGLHRDRFVDVGRHDGSVAQRAFAAERSSSR